jgi:hypothetical protein
MSAALMPFPNTPAPQWQHIPHDLKDRAQWIMWRWAYTKDAKLTKVPIEAATGGQASSTDPATWCAYNALLLALHGPRQGSSGAGFVVTEADPYCGIDLDKCRDAETGDIAPWAQREIDRFGSYTEVTVSGTGIRIWLRGSKGTHARCKVPVQVDGILVGTLECYDQGRFFTLSGHHIPTTPTTIEPRQAELDAFLSEHLPARPQRESQPPRAPGPLARSDAEIIEHAMRATNGGAFVALFRHGDLSGYDGDQSRADLALASHLAFWTNGDAGTVDRLFRQSALMREKWDERRGTQTYGERTIEAALAGQTEGYTGARNGSAPAITATDPQDRERPPDDTVKPFPVEVLPESLRRFVVEGAAAKGCPVDFIAVPLLVYAGAAIGATRVLKVKNYWYEAPRVWAAPVGEPGDKKTPALDLARTAVDRHQRTLAKQHRDALKKWENDDKTTRGDKPRLEQVMTTDATLEALAGLLGDNPRGILMAQDELTGWVRGMGQYKQAKGADRQQWLSLWSGSPIIVNRRNRPDALVLPRPFVAVCGGLQPDMLGELSDERGRRDGFIHRVLFTHPDPMPLGEWTEAEVAPSTLDACHAVFAQLFALEPVQDDTDGTACPQEVTFTKDGKAVWVEWFNAHTRQVNAPTFSLALRGPWAKLVSYAARFALILQGVRKAAGEASTEDVDAVSVAGAADLIEYFKSHARRVYRNLLATPEDKQVTEALVWMRRRGGTTFTSREVQNSGLHGIHKREDAQALLRLLDDRGYGKATDPEKVKGGTRVTFTLGDNQRSTVDS